MTAEPAAHVSIENRPKSRPDGSRTPCRTKFVMSAMNIWPPGSRYRWYLGFAAGAEDPTGTPGEAITPPAEQAADGVGR
jgi:hypothetical protein